VTFASCRYLLGALGTAAATVLLCPLWCVPRVRHAWAAWHRRRAGRLLGTPASTGRVPAWREAGWLLAHVAVGGGFGLGTLLCVGNLLTVPVASGLWWLFPADDPPRLFVDVAVTSWPRALGLGLAQALLTGAAVRWAVPPAARAYARLTVAVLTPLATERLAARVDTLTRTRAGVLDAHGTELRRIERDLHDGTQARLVAIAVRLAMARDAHPQDPEVVATLLRDAHENTEEAMTELRAVIRTMYPPVLADHGLAHALEAAAVNAAVSARTDIGDLGDVPAAVEAVAYFAVTEALTNATKHSRCTTVTVRAHRAGDRLHVRVTDDGIGGAEESRGTGLTGVRRRAAALDGDVRLDSPAGGPTTLTLDLPCGS
jgi:signal transduction histidine kinase